MSEKETIAEKPAVLEKIPQKENKLTKIKESWKPKTALGKKVLAGEITQIDEIFDKKTRLFESEIVDLLLPNLESDLLLIGQAKGKFGGGQKRVFRQTQKKTAEGNKPSFATCAVVGNKNGYVGVGYGKSRETVPARDKAQRNAKLSLFKIRRGVGSWQDAASDPHSIPFMVEGKCGSVTIQLMPAPKGTGLVIEKECAKILRLAGIKDVWSKTYGKTKTKMNLIYACVDALKKLTTTKIREGHRATLCIAEGKITEK